MYIMVCFFMEGPHLSVPTVKMTNASASYILNRIQLYSIEKKTHLFTIIHYYLFF